MDGIALMASAMHAAQARLDVAAVNLANVSTDGFRRSVARAALGDGGLVVTTTRDVGQGALRGTGRNFDLAVAGEGAMLVRGGDGRLHRERSASFERGASGHLSDQNGGLLMGSRGPLVVDADTVIDGLGVARGAGKIIDRVQLVPGTLLRSGFLEAANVDAVHEMVDVLSAQRAFETAQKTLRAIDDVRGKSASETARVKA